MTDALVVDVAARAPVWRAIAELYLDTELQPYDYRAVAEALAASPYTLEALHEIDRWEVAPVVGANLMVPAGVWAGFDEAWIARECEARARDAARRRLRERRGVRGWIRDRLYRPMTRTAWARLDPIIAELRAGRAGG